MTWENPLLHILSTPGALIQDLDDGFLLLTHLNINEIFGAADPIANSAIDGAVKEAMDNLKAAFQILSHEDAFQLFTPIFFDISPHRIKNFPYAWRIQRGNLTQLLESALSTESLPQLSWIPQNRESFEKDFQQIQTKIQTGQIDKAVVMTTEKSSWKPNNKERVLMLLNLLHSCPRHLYIYSHWDSQSGVIGATPEFLFYRQGATIQSMALAGTLDKRKLSFYEPELVPELAPDLTPKLDSMLAPESAAGSSANKQLSFQQLQIDFIENEKELLEHQLVVDDLTEKLRQLTTQTSINPIKIIEYPHLFHLQTEIQAELSAIPSASDFDFTLAQKMHPSSALGLRSQNIHWHWLKELNGHQHINHFGAPVGVTLPGGFLCLVGIRNLEWDENGSYLRAGCGIVSQSSIDNEWQELEAKRESVKSLLGLNS